MNMIKKEIENFGKKKYILFLLLIIVISCCNTRHEICEDNVLEEFRIDDEALDSVILSVLGNRDGAFPDINKDSGKVLSLNLHYRDSVILFVFSFSTKQEFAHDIFRNNYRVVGYAKYPKKDLILLSDVNSLTDFGSTFSRFIHPTSNKCSFEYVNFHKSQYSCKEFGIWPTFEVISDPLYLVYKYENNQIGSPILTTNYELYR